MLEILVAWFGDALRQQSGYGRLDLPEDAEHTAKLAHALSPAALGQRIAAVEGLRDDLATNVQESMAIEVAFLEAFGGD
jgi:DNA polymerase-3 subunit delta'